MIDLIKKFFNGDKDSTPAETAETASHDLHVATCALLMEMSHIDGEFNESEKASILDILKKDYDLSDEHASELMKAADAELEQSTDLWQFTNLINQNYSLDEKLRIIEIVWKVAYVDGRLDKHEDYLMHKLANLLRLTHRQLIDAKLKVTSS